MKAVKGLLVVIFSYLSYPLMAEPWIDTRDAYLRADIEMLADIGIITVPISTYPLAWAGIIKNIDQVNISQVPAEYKDIYWRVKRAGKEAISHKANRELRVSASNSEQAFRSFGDSRREQGELSGRNYQLTKNFAWNIEVTQVYDPRDNEKTRYDGSYIAGIYDNWILAAGAIEKWWGPSWDSSNILSNNARPPLGVMLQRNYSEASKLPLLEWIGAWTFNVFAAKLDDERFLDDAQLTGVAFNFKPHDSVEIGLRASALWGGEGRTNSFESFVDNFIANESCILSPSPSPYICNSDYSDTGDRIAGIDFRWKIPGQYPIVIYGSGYGEDDRKFLPSKNVTQFGITSSFFVRNSRLKWFVEASDTKLGSGNEAYESQVYQTGFRYYGRSIGSTYDNDSNVISLGILGHINRRNKFSVKASNMRINRDGLNLSDIARHTISSSEQNVSRLELKWFHKTNQYGEFDISLDYFDEESDLVKSQLRLSWTYQFN